MADLLTTGVSGLSAMKKIMDMTAHNVSNYNTPGYSRQVADLCSRYDQTNTWNTGSGVRVCDIRRIYDEFLNGQITTNESSFSQCDETHNLMEQLSTFMKDDASTLGSAMSDLTKSIHGILANPGSTATRQSFISATKNLDSRLAFVNHHLQMMQQKSDNNIVEAVTRINNLAQKIADMTTGIASIERKSDNLANDARDQQELYVRELNKILPCSYKEDEQGIPTITVGNGQILVQNHTAYPIIVSSNTEYVHQATLAIQYPNFTTALLPTETDGQLGARYHFQTETVQEIRNHLGLLAAVIGHTLNTIQKSGLDENDQWGADIFFVDQPRTEANFKNTSTASLAASFQDDSQLVMSTYRLQYDGTQWTVLREGDGKSWQYTKLPAQIDGLSLTITGTPEKGDIFLIRAGDNVLNNFRTLITRTDQIAQALPVRVSENYNNTGTAHVDNYDVDDQYLQPLNASKIFNTVQIVFSSATQYNLMSTDGKTTFLAQQTYTPRQPIRYNGWQVTISGLPISGDQFTVEKNTNARGDTANLTKMLQFSSQKILNSGTQNVVDAYAGLLEHIGASTQQAGISAKAQFAVLMSLEKKRQSIAGVNLDEEAAYLLQLQQLYMANAKVIQVGSKVIQEVLDLLR